jgi:hypothetical protein
MLILGTIFSLICGFYKNPYTSRTSGDATHYNHTSTTTNDYHAGSTGLSLHFIKTVRNNCGLLNVPIPVNVFEHESPWKKRL